MHRYFFLMVAACILLLTGCRTPQTVKDAWKGTRSYYYEYLNTPAKLNLDDKGNISDYEAALGAAIADFDLRLQELERALENSDQNPDAAWVSTMTARFPWLSGVALTDETGYPRAKLPQVYAKSFEIGSLLEVDPKQQIKDLRAFVQEDPLGPEIYVGNPVYIGADFRGVITVHFDPRALLARTADAAHVMLIGPNGVLWPGIYDVAATPVADVNWAERLKKDISGIERNDLGAFYWICRYIGNLPLVYAIRIEGDFPLNEDNMQGLAVANSYTLGPVDISMLQPQQQEATDLGLPPIEMEQGGQNSPLTEPVPAPATQEGMPISE